MKKLLVQTNFNQKDFPHTTEVNTKPSMAVPDDSLSIRQLIENHTRQLPVLGSVKEKVFLGEDEIVDFTMDNIDRLDMLDAIKGDINAIRTNHLQKVEEQQQKQKQKAPPQPSEKEGDAAGGERSTEQPQAKRSEAPGAK